jgi:hypothetical protein
VWASILILLTRERVIGPFIIPFVFRSIPILDMSVLLHSTINRIIRRPNEPSDGIEHTGCLRRTSRRYLPFCMISLPVLGDGDGKQG